MRHINEWPWEPYQAMASEAATRYGLAPELVLAIVGTESAFNPRAYRFEPKINDASRGLMQILLATAQGMGYTGDAEGLYDAATNLDLGARYLAWQVNRYPGNLTDAISAYNGGHALKVGAGYANQAYVDQVISAWGEFADALASWSDPNAPDSGPVGLGPSGGGSSTGPLSTGLLLAGGLVILIAWGLLRR